MDGMNNSARKDADVAPTSSCVVHCAPVDARQRQRLTEMYERQELTDVVLLVQGERLPAHRVVLAAASPFFHALFTSGMRESHASHVELHEMNATALRELLRYMYEGQLAIDGDTILALLNTANQLEMEEVVEICCKQLMLELCVSNCVHIYMCCESLNMRVACRLLSRAAACMIETFFADVVKTEAFLNLSLPALLQILSRAKLKLGDGDAILSWFSHDPKERQADLPLIFKSLACTEDAARRSVSLQLYQRLSGKLYQALGGKPLVNVQEHLAQFHQRFTSPRTSKRRLTPTIFAIGGFNGPSALRSVEYMDFHTQQWHQASSMHEQRSYSGAVVTEQNVVYVLGGAASPCHLRSVEMYEPELDRWTLQPAMKRARSYLGAVYLNGYIYAVGGFNGNSHLDCVERFSIRTQQWEDIAPLCVGRSGLAVVAMNGLIYAVGGYDGRRHLKSVEVYDPRTNEWTQLPDMLHARNGPAAVADAKANRIIVFGGESRHGERLSTSEALALDGGAWTEFAAFLDSRSGHAAVGFLNDSFLFCLGGSNKKDEYLDTVHRFDHLTQQWIPHSQLIDQRCGLNVVIARTSSSAACFAAQRQQEVKKDGITNVWNADSTPLPTQSSRSVTQMFSYAAADFS
ncbi:TPA: hypothetical protein N0F65_012840 [Lagenidium giganteum]|uniref:BTB domain-containing protein n=1 Tax=Lagenidium giganteum TaxID=4803 RepID=A0AAV2YNA9_9STRA|nr:TPA: hypothetical protein N0F65_012840 [Lagenidium giganteum]